MRKQSLVGKALPYLCLLLGLLISVTTHAQVQELPLVGQFGGTYGTVGLAGEVADGATGGLRVVDITDPANPVKHGL